ncbi:MAG TPA: hypothetical protein PK668_17410 [Myxococcota bacterium]|nr:hypothetical protein [Myxococcota bacterium]HRY94939.1 hypothetical protein [Myxococcota bacterium]
MKRWVVLAGVFGLFGWLSGCDSGGGPCGSCDDGVACTVDTCDEALVECAHAPSDELCAQGERCNAETGCEAAPACEVDADCDDYVFCNGAETCGGGTCQAGTVACDDGVACTTDTCDENMNQCVNEPDDARCAADQVCDRDQGCILAQPCSLDSDCDDDDPCSNDTCVQEVCRHAANSGAACDDGLYCTDPDTCAAGVCIGVPRDCGPAEYPCDENVCVEADGGCVTRPRAPGAACDDEDYCTVGETCQDSECTGGTPRDCAGELGPCQTGVCDADAQACVGEPANDLEPCDDQDPCTLDDICYTGECVGEPDPCDDENACTLDSCTTDDGCVHDPDPACNPTGSACESWQGCVGAVCMAPEEGYPEGMCSQYCTPGAVACVGDAVCAERDGDFICVATCALTGGDTCPRPGYQCANVGGAQGGCVPGEDLCEDGQDNDIDGQADCLDYDCAVADNCLQTCNAGSLLTCGQVVNTQLTSAASVYGFYPGCSTHFYGGAEHVYQFTAAEDGVLTVTLDTDGFYGALFVLSEACTPQLTCAGMDEQFGVDTERVSVPVVAGRSYFAVVEGYDLGEQGQYTLEVICGEPELCTDLADNDLDGAIDCADADCVADPACEGHEFICNDNEDNDGDEEYDCFDTDCEASPVCLPEEPCNDNLDNDQDGDTDCWDWDCVSAPACAAEHDCTDGVDNDADSLLDCYDDDCAETYDCSAEHNCNDGQDNDVDGWPDCEDNDCLANPVCIPEAECTNTQDDDLDGLIDCDDPDCSVDVACADTCAASGVADGCWDQINGNTGGQANNFETYACDDYYTFSGPERVYSFTPTESGTIYFYIGSNAFDAYLFILKDACIPASLDACVGYTGITAGTSDSIELIVEAGHTYYAVIDSLGMAEAGAFTFRPDCMGEEVCNDGADNDLDGATDCADLDPGDCMTSPFCVDTCTATEELTCDMWGDASSTTSSSAIDDYMDVCPGTDYPGGEKIYHYRGATTQVVDVRIEASLFSDMAVAVVTDTCTPSVTTEYCEDDRTGMEPIAVNEHVYFQAEANVDYYIIVDSIQSGRKYFIITVGCNNP